jgi:hypothetical protein
MESVMDSWSSTREVEKVPKTRTERHTALYNQAVQKCGELSTLADNFKAVGMLTVAAQLRETATFIATLSRELKPDTSKHVG